MYGPIKRVSGWGKVFSWGSWGEAKDSGLKGRENAGLLALGTLFISWPEFIAFLAACEYWRQNEA